MSLLLVCLKARCKVMFLKNLLNDDTGATMVEYSIMVSLIAAICILVVTAIGQGTKGEFNAVNRKF